MLIKGLGLLLFATFILILLQSLLSSINSFTTVLYASSGKLFSLLKCPRDASFKPLFIKKEIVLAASKFANVHFGPAILCFNKYGYGEHFKISGS